MNSGWVFDPSEFRGLCVVRLPWGDLAVALMFSRVLHSHSKHHPEPCYVKNTGSPPTPPPKHTYIHTHFPLRSLKGCFAIVLLLWPACGYETWTKMASKKCNLLRPILAWTICHNPHLCRRLNLAFLFI